MSRVESNSTAATIQRLRKAWCIRINGLNTFNADPEPGKSEESRVPEANAVPKSWLGRWGVCKDYTFICLPSGDLFILYGEPCNELRTLIQEVCTSGENLRVPYFDQESLYCHEIIARVKDPFCQF